jgi:hypothetical protein
MAPITGGTSGIEAASAWQHSVKALDRALAAQAEEHLTGTVVLALAREIKPQR